VLLAEVPLADDRGVVAGGAENLGERHAPVVEPTVRSERLGQSAAVEMPHAGLVRVEPGEQGGPRRAAAGRVGEVREPQASRRQGVDVGRGDLAAVAAEVAEADVVDEDHDHVRASWRLGRRACRVGGRPDSRRGQETRKPHEQQAMRQRCPHAWSVAARTIASHRTTGAAGPAPLPAHPDGMTHPIVGPWPDHP